MSLNIAIFSDSYKPQINGVVTQIANLSAELSKHGHKVMVVAPSPDSKHHEKESNGVKEIYLPSIALPTYPDYRITHFSSSRVFKALKSFRPDAVHVQTPFSVGWLGVRYAKKLKVPLIGTYHTLLPEFLVYLPIPLLKGSGLAKALTWKYTTHFYNKCDAITTPSEAMKRELERHGSKKVTVISNAIDFALFNSQAKKKFPKRGEKLLYFGRIGFEKNIEVLVFAVKHLLWRDKKISLTITGSGPAVNYLKELVRAEKLSKHVHFHAAMKAKELARHVASHDVFVTASTIETQGLTILESMAAGIPCVGADYMAIPDTVKEGNNGFLFKAFDFVACAHKLEKIIASPALRKKLGRNAVEAARKHSAESIVSQWEKLYSKVRN